MKYSPKKLVSGFTLIELLVVIAIIGVLSSVVLASLSSARNKGVNANIKGNLNNIRAQAELYYDTHASSYANLCTADTIVVKAKNAAASVTGSTVVDALATAQGPTTLNCHVSGSGNQYAISAPLKLPEGLNVYWCIDHAGFSGGRVNPLLANLTNCPSS